MRNLVAAMFFCMLIGCSVASLNKDVIRQEPYNNVEKKSLTVSANKLVDAVEMQRTIGKSYRGLACVPNGELRWRGSDKFISEVSNNIRKKLDAYGYSLLGKAYSPFNEEFSRQSELILGGKIIDIQSNACYSDNGAKGEAYVKVEWEIYDNRTKSTTLILPTEGYSSVKEFTKSGDTELFNQAFDMAIDNLLAAREFYTLLTKGK